MKDLNAKLLFWASFLTLIAAGMGMAMRTATSSGTGRPIRRSDSLARNLAKSPAGAWSVSASPSSSSVSSPIAIGYGKHNGPGLFCCTRFFRGGHHARRHADPDAASGKDGAYWCLYIGMFLFALGNGTCEAVINPLTATLFPKEKTHWLNILHAGWPGGLVLGGSRT